MKVSDTVSSTTKGSRDVNLILATLARLCFNARSPHAGARSSSDEVANRHQEVGGSDVRRGGRESGIHKR